MLPKKLLSNVPKLSSPKLFLWIAFGVLIIYIATLRGFTTSYDSFQSLNYKIGYGTAFESPHERSSYLL
ncbi:MAG: hypothetical protein K0S38_1043, partial [Candidatus Paceibacter sp.]|nr:hypothetical protein [Candidatus Paceibacter sp.]